jgi:hypothetical protein
MGAPIFSVLLNGNLNNGDLSKPLHPNDLHLNCVYQMNIRQIIYEKNTPATYSVAVSSNLVKGHQFCEKSQKFKIAPLPLKLFVMKSNVNDKKIQSFDEVWHYISNSRELNIFFVDLETNEKLTIDCKVSILLDIKQIS